MPAPRGVADRTKASRICFSHTETCNSSKRKHIHTGETATRTVGHTIAKRTLAPSTPSQSRNEGRGANTWKSSRSTTTTRNRQKNFRGCRTTGATSDFRATLFTGLFQLQSAATALFLAAAVGLRGHSRHCTARDQDQDEDADHKGRDVSRALPVLVFHFSLATPKRAVRVFLTVFTSSSHANTCATFNASPSGSQTFSPASCDVRRTEK